MHNALWNVNLVSANNVKSEVTSEWMGNEVLLLGLAEHSEC